MFTRMNCIFYIFTIMFFFFRRCCLLFAVFRCWLPFLLIYDFTREVIERVSEKERKIESAINNDKEAMKISNATLIYFHSLAIGNAYAIILMSTAKKIASNANYPQCGWCNANCSFELFDLSHRTTCILCTEMDSRFSLFGVL